MGAPDASPPAQTAEESTSAEDRETRHGTDESHATSAMVQLAGAVIGALGTGVGILAIVALFGGLKMLARLRAAGLPGTEGMANMPRGLLVAVGADELIPVVLFATVAALAVWMAGPRRHTTRASTSTAPDRTPQMAAVTASVATGGAAIACALYIFLAGIGEIDRNAVLMIAVFALLGSASAWLAHQHGHSIAPPALLFATCLVVGGLLLYWTNVADPELRPAAVLRADGSVLAGAWIARNDDWFFLGRLSAEEGAGGRLIAVPADSIEGFSIDAYRSPDEVEERSSELAAVLRCDLTRTNC